MDVPEPLDWRAVLALLANADARAALATITEDPRLPENRRRAALAKWERTGVLTTDADGARAVDEERLLAAVRAAAARRPTGVERFLGTDGRIRDYPSRVADRRQLLELLADRVLARDEVVDEAELNERLTGLTDDVATLRRHLVDARLLSRAPDGTRYRR
ncbi:MAG: DUF2087 domain-containing protein [Propionicimonas sp.]|uniref:DUF2087 domain-containing protein n=1 Tax=Propionicimonas sp. TaxID=1955623 RepID=UPI003D0A9ABF